MNWSSTFGSAPASASRIASWMRLWLRSRMNRRRASFLKSPVCNALKSSGEGVL